MSYNIDTFKLKKVKDFKLPIEAFYDKKFREDWRPERPQLMESGQIKIEGGAEGFEVIGMGSGPYIVVDKITIYGEGSGTFYRDILSEVFKKSTGYLEFKAVWEGGDSITHTIVDNGKITETDVEL